MKTELHTQGTSVFLTLTPETLADKNELQHRYNQALSMRVRAVWWAVSEGPLGHPLSIRVSVRARGASS